MPAQFSLRPYQESMVATARECIRMKIRRLILQSATGSGKTLCAAHIIHSATGRGNRTLFVAHRKELIEQASQKLTAYEVDHGIIMARHWRYRPKHHVQIASIQTLMRRELPPCDLLILDEAHRSMGASYRRLIDHYPEAVVLGLTATPTRIDGKGLGDIFQKIISGPTIQELILQGYLVPVRHFAPFTPGLASVRTVAGDYDEHVLSDIMDKPQLVGDVVEHWKKLAVGRQTIVFATSIEHSRHLADAFVRQNISAIHIDGKTKPEVRDHALKGLASGFINVVCNVGIGVEGLDIPVVSCVVLARPTKSLTLYLQACGRGSRPADGKKDNLILDHAGCAIEHGLVTEDREWTLESSVARKKNKEKEISVATCPKCFAAYNSKIKTCPNCGFVAPVNYREVDQVDGSLVEVDEKNFKRFRRAEVARANSFESLQAIAHQRGYKDGWAQLMWSIKKRRMGKTMTR